MSEFNELSKCVPRIFLYTFPSKLLIDYLISKCADYLSCVWNWSREKKVKINMTARRIQFIIWFMINWSLIDFFRLLAELLALNTTSGPFRKLGRLYESCLRQAMNSSTIRLLVEKLGGYLPLNSLGPKSIANLVTKINEIGPNPLIDIYYDLSYGRKPRVLLIIDGPIDPSHLLEVSDFVWQFFWILAHNSFHFQNPVRWQTPKSPPFRVDEDVPVLLDELLKYFLPFGLSVEQKVSEKKAVSRFIRELNQIRKQDIYRDFANSYVVNNISSLSESYEFVSIILLRWCQTRESRVILIDGNSIGASVRRRKTNFPKNSQISAELERSVAK